jgi:hypothetical protein
MSDKLPIKGRVELFVTRGCPTIKENDVIDFSTCELLDTQVLYNILVNEGKDKIISSLAPDADPIQKICRMAIGDRGTLPSDPQVPKVPTPDMDSLYNEVYRADLDSVVKNVGTPTTHEIKFIKTFSSVVIPISAFSNQAAPTVNEVALINSPQGIGFRDPVSAPDSPLADESVFSIRTFKSVPFEAANEIAITIRYTIFIE